MSSNALERLYQDATLMNNDEPQYSTEELLNVDDEKSFLENMSSESKDFLLSKIQQVTLDDVDEIEEDALEELPIEEEEVNTIEEEFIEDTFEEDTFEEEVFEEEPVIEQEVEQEVKRRRGRPRKEETLQVIKEEEEEERKMPERINSLNMFMDSLARDLIQELRDKQYETRNFNREQMLVILDYLEKKI